MSGTGVEASGITQEKLQVLLDGHIRYELDELIHDHNTIVKGDVIEHGNAVLEAFLIHGRNLVEFFFPDRRTVQRRPNHVWAFEYFEGGWRAWEATGARSKFEIAVGHRVGDVIGAVSQTVGHLTIQRSGRLGWNVPQIAIPLVYAYQRWEEGLSTAVIEARVRHAGEHHRNALQMPRDDDERT
jgi:hypothetical protein